MKKGFINAVFLVFGVMFFQPLCATATYRILGTPPMMDAALLNRLQQWRDTIPRMVIKHSPHLIINGIPTAKTVALTFDDGPDGKVTPAVLDTLKKYGIKATFFFLGERLEKYKDVVLRAHHEGHAIFSHTWSHPNLIKLTAEQITTELISTQEALTALIGPIPLIFRPPYGSINPLVVETYKRLGYQAYLWSLDTCDWALLEKNAIANTVIGHTRPGEIILMHSNDGRQPSADALPTIIEWLITEGFGFARIDDPVFNPLTYEIA